MRETDTDPGEEDPTPTADEGSIRDSFAGLIASGRELAHAELAWAKLKTQLVGLALRRAAIFGVLALVLLVIGGLVLVAAGVIALSPHVGLLGATLIVAGASIALAVLLGLAAKRAVRGLFETDIG